MWKIEVRGAKAGDSSDWNHAWKVVAQLAEARGATLREIGAQAPSAATPGGAPAPKPASESAPAAAPVAAGQLARDIAEIEQAATALRRAEPTLEPRTPTAEASSEPRGSRSIWVLVSVIWLTAVLVVSSTVGAAMLLLS
ncbi:MAG TPA: hypothetical protein VIY51_00845 [Xanthobacteraceae bacterium]